MCASLSCAVDGCVSEAALSARSDDAWFGSVTEGVCSGV